MEKTLSFGLWAVIALYVVVGVFGLVFPNVLPDTQQLTDGYGVSYATTAAFRTAR
jgi:hypothetical protein